jgi:hypothetical protein
MEAALGALTTQLTEHAARIHLIGQKLDGEFSGVTNRAYNDILGRRPTPTQTHRAGARVESSPYLEGDPSDYPRAVRASGVDNPGPTHLQGDPIFAQTHRAGGGVRTTRLPRSAQIGPAQSSRASSHAAPAAPEMDQPQFPTIDPHSKRAEFVRAFHSARDGLDGSSPGGGLGMSFKQIGISAALRADESLSKHILASDDAKFSIRKDVNGKHHWVDTDGNKVADVTNGGKGASGARAGEVQDFLSSTSRRGRFAAGLAVRGGGSLLGGAAELFGPAAIGAGIAVEGTKKAIEFAQNQREANRTYQQISGGTNTSGFYSSNGYASRVGEKMFSLEQMGTMNGGQASALYQGVAQLGLKGSEQNDALSFATDNFRKTGLDVATSMDMISTAVKHGNTNFAALAKGVQAVGDAAKSAGTNVGEAQKVYATNFQTVTANTTQGSAAADIAKNLTVPLTSMGESMNGIDLTGMLSPGQLYRQAGLLGVNPATYQNQVAAGGTTGTAASASGIDKVVQQTIDGVVPAATQKKIQDQVQVLASRSQDGKPTPDQIKEVTAKVYQEDGINLDALMSAEQNLNIQGLSMANIQGFSGAQIMGTLKLTNQNVSTQDPTGINGDPTQINGKSIMSGGRTSQATQMDSTSNSAFGSGSSDLAQQNVDLLTSKTGGLEYDKVTTTDNGVTTTGVDYKGRDGKVFRQYLQGVHDTGQRNQAVEKLLSANSEDYSGSRFKVNTKQGPKEVGLQDLVAHYADQAAAGTVTVTQGQGQGHTLQEITGIAQGDGKYSAGQDAASGAGDVSSANGTVTIDLTDTAKSFIKVSSTTGSAVDNARTTGVSTPSNPNPVTLPRAQGTSGG